jgi:hypothetical protein
LRKHVKNHSLKDAILLNGPGRRKSTASAKPQKNESKSKRRFSESAVRASVETENNSAYVPLTPNNPSCNTNIFNFDELNDDVFENTTTTMNFNDMSNCLTNMLESNDTNYCNNQIEINQPAVIHSFNDIQSKFYCNNDNIYDNNFQFNDNNFHATITPTTTATPINDSEYVSYDYVKKFLCDNMDYIEQQPNQFEIDYLDSVV